MPDKNFNVEDDIERIAIIGMACRFPGADNVDEFWQNIKNGIESIIDFNDEELRSYGIPEEWIKAPNFVKRGTILNNIDKFDASFFGYSPRDALFMDPQQRIFLELAYESLENAGYTTESCDNSIGVFAGVSPNEYLNIISSSIDSSDNATQMELLINNDKDFLSTRVSYKMDLKGPSMTVQAGCSTSLLATHLACQSLLSYQCSLAMTGGTCVNLTKSRGYFYQDGVILSPDGHCRAFDEKARGTVSSQGVAVIVLKRLSEAIADGDHIYAAIRGSAVNNDGGAKIGYTAPSVDGQAEVIAMAHAVSDTPAETIGYIETHGTGTIMGDPIEIEALTRAFRMSTSKKQFCAIGSVKTNIGHTDITAGLAGVIKTALMLKNREIPPSLNFTNPNPEINFSDSPFYVSTEFSEWNSGNSPRRAGVSSFGIGGTNVHVILEEAKNNKPPDKSRNHQLLMISARTESALNTACQKLSSYIKQSPDFCLPDASFTLQVGRKRFNHRRVIICNDKNDAVLKLEGHLDEEVITGDNTNHDIPVTFLFSGQGTQYAGMGYELYKNEAIFREYMDKCFSIIAENHSIDLSRILFPVKEKEKDAHELITQTAMAQLSLFVIEYSLAQLWISWGIKPESMVGHSIGEYAAACISGVFTLETAIAIVTARGSLMQEAESGAMIAVDFPVSEASSIAGDALSIAAINTPQSFVVSGDFPAISSLEYRLEEKKISYRRLHTSHAFHSKMMEPILEKFREEVSRHKLNAPAIPFLSNLTGKWITDDEARNPDYWVKHLRSTVLFSECIKTLMEKRDGIILETGPGNTLCSLVMQQRNKQGLKNVFSSLPRADENTPDQKHLITTLGRLWVAGIEPDWNNYYKFETRHRIPLPSYPFERKSYWPVTKDNTVTKNQTTPFYLPSDISDVAIDNNQNKKILDRSNNEIELKLISLWEDVLKINGIKNDDNFFELGGNSLIGANLIALVNKEFKINLAVNSIFYAPTVSLIAKLIGKKITDNIKQEKSHDFTQIENDVKMLGLGS